MKRNVFSVVLILIVCLLLSACSESPAKIAKSAFETGDYAAAVEALEGQVLESEELKNIQRISEIYLAKAEEDYNKVVKLFDGFNTEDEELNRIFAEAKAKLALDVKEYGEAIDRLKSAGLEELPIYAEAVRAAVEDAFSKAEVSTLAALCEKGEDIADIVTEKLMQRCDDFDYDAFLLLDKLCAELADGSAKDQLEQYAAEHGKTRTKAFLKGDWEWLSDEETTAIVNLHVSEDDSQCLGFVKRLSTLMTEYHYSERDLYWKDFIFADNDLIALYNLTRQEGSGTAVSNTASVKLDIDNGKMSIHITDSIVPDRTWQRLG